MLPAYCDTQRVEPTATTCTVPVMKATKELSDNLQAVLVDLIELHIQGKQAHWNVVGTNFRDTHLILDEIVDTARELSDEVAERMRALHALPDGRSETVSSTTTLPKFSADQLDTAEVVSLITERLDAAAATCRRVHDAVDEADPTSADILHKLIETLEKYAWMVSAESLKPQKRNAATGL
jgi:starvation-inducible DNA-binding protein